MNTNRRRPRNTRPTLDWLEARALLTWVPGTPAESIGNDAIINMPPTGAAQGGLQVISTDPVLALEGHAETASRAGSPTRIIVSFNERFDTTMLSPDAPPFMLQSLVDSQPGDNVFDNTPPTAVEFSPDGLSLSITLGAPLAPGPYRIVVPAGVPLQSLDGTMLAPENDLVLGDFSISAHQPGVTLTDALDLGTLGASVLTTPGSLDFTSNPAAVGLYRFELAPGPDLWQFGVDVVGDVNLATSLTIFDHEGTPIATQALARFGFPNDTFLFKGLAPGSYYVGVSGAGNLGGQPGGYDVRTGDPGTTRQALPGGAFSLQAVATPVDAPTRAIDFRLLRPDPLDQTPVGFTIQFSSAVQVKASTAGAIAPLVLVDAQGATQGLVLTDFDETQALLTYRFAQPLAPGVYRVLVPTDGGLIDLADRTPRADDPTATDLAHFVLEAADGGPKASPHDLGLVYPARPASEGRPITIAPDGPVSVRFVVAQPGLYALQTQGSAAGLSLNLIGPDESSRTLDAGAPGTPTTNLVQLNRVGAYRLVLSVFGPLSVQTTVTISEPVRDADSVIRNGIGQGPALDLRLVSPKAPLPSTPTPTPTNDDPGAAHRTPAGPAPLGPSIATPTTNVTAMGEGLASTRAPGVRNDVPVVDLGGQLVGRPDPKADIVGLVSSALMSGPQGQAPNQPRPFDGTTSDLPSGTASVDPTPWSGGDDLPTPTTIAPDGAIVAGRNPRSEEGPDEPTETSPDWVDRALAALNGLFGPKAAASLSADESSSEAGRADDPILAEWEKNATPKERQVNLAEPVGVMLVAAALARRGRRSRREKTRQDARVHNHVGPAGPHYSRKRTKV